MKHAKTVSMFVLILLAVAGMLSLPSAALGANRIKADTTNALNTAGSWVGGAVTANDIAIWDATIVTNSNATNGFAVNANTWGGIKISNPPVTVNILSNYPNLAANNRVLSLGAGGLEVAGTQDLIVGNTLNAVVAQTWTIGAGRTLTLEVGRNTTFGANTLIGGPGEIIRGRILDVTSNAVLTLTNDIAISTTPGTDTPQFRIGQTAAAGSGTVVQHSGTVTLRRLTTAAVLLIGNNDSASSYTISGGTLDTRDNGITKSINVANGAGGSGVFTVNGTGQVLAAVINIGNNATQTGADMSVSGNSVVETHNIVVANNGPGTLTVSGNASVTVTNTFRIGPNSPNLGNATVNLNGGRLTVGGLVRGTGVESPAAGVLNLNGGILTMQRPTLDFSPVNVSNVVVRLDVLAGGAVFDTAGFSITNRAPLLDGDGGAGGLTKLGAGELHLYGANTFTGPTVVSNGAVILSTAQTGNGSVTINDGAGLGVLVNTVGASLPATDLTLGSSAGPTSLLINASTNGNPTAAVITTGNLIVNGTVNVTIVAAGNGLSIGTFKLIDYNALGGSGGFTPFPVLPDGVLAQIVTNNIDGSIDLNVTFVPPALTWNGTVSSDWTVGGDANWRDLSLALTPFTDGAGVTFDDNAQGTTTITLNSLVAPGGVAMNFTHSASNYSITGTGSIVGTVGLDKSGAGTLVMGTTNNYFGDTIISAGTFQLAADQVIPDGVGRGNLQLDGTLDLNGFAEAVNGFNGAGIVDNTAVGPATFAIGSNNVAGLFSGAIQNTGGALTLVKIGTQTNTLQGVNTYSGGTIIAQGILRVDPGSSLGPVSAPWSFGATLLASTDLTNTASVFEMIGAATINASNGAVVTIGPATILNTNDYALTKNGDGTLNLTASGAMGGFRIASGTAVITGSTITNNTFTSIGQAAGVATMVLSGSTLMSTNADVDFNVSDTANTMGTLHVTNGSTLGFADLFIGKIQNTTGMVYQSSGVVTNVDVSSSQEIGIAGNNTSATTHNSAFGRYFISGGRLDVGKAFLIGRNGNGALDISGGAQVNNWGSGNTVVGRYANSLGVLNITNGSFSQLDPAAQITIGNASTGIVNVGTSGLLSSADNIQLGSAATGLGIVNLNSGGTIRAQAITDGTGLSTFNFNGGTLEAITNAGDFMSDLTNAVLQASSTINTGTNTITIRQDFSGGGGLTKSGTGTLIMSGSNHTYSGATTVSEGSLLIVPGYVGVSSVSVNNGAAFGARRTAAGATATAAFVNFDSGSTVVIDLGTFGNSTAPVLSIPGDQENGFTGFTTAGAVNVQVSGANLSVGTITLIQYGDPETLSPGNALLAGTLTLPRGVVGTLNNTGSQIQLIITSVAPLFWTGATDNVWDINTTTNWVITNLATVYLDNDAVPIFNDDGNNTDILITNNVAPSQVIISNASKAYTFGGPGLITGSGGITKLGTGTLIIANSNNTYTGATLIDQGTLRFGTNDVLPNSAAASNLIVNGTLDVNGFGDTVRGLDGSGIVDNTGATNATLIIGANGASGSFSGVIQDTSGDLLLQKNGAGTNTLSNPGSTWNGGLFINAGVVNFNANHVFGSGPVILGGGGTLATLNGVRSVTNLVLGTNTGTATFNTDGGDLTLSGIVTFDGPELAKSGANTLIVPSTAVVNLGTASGFDLTGGSLLIDGGSWTHANDGFRLRATTNFTTVSVTLQNNGVLNTLGGASFQLGNTADTNFTTTTRATNVFTLTSGTVSIGTGTINVGATIGNVGIFNQNGGTVTSTNAGNNNGVVLGSATNTSGTFNLNAGTLVTARIRKTGTNDTFARFVFGGGTLKALNGNAVPGTNFIGGLDELLVQAAGAKIDSDAFDIDVNQALTEDPSSTGGGLTKSGTGALAVNGINSYTGSTVVNAGVLRGKGSVPNSLTGAGKVGGGDRDEFGTFTINGDSSVTGGALMRVGKTGVLLSNDVVTVTGTHNLAGELTVASQGDALAAGDSFDLFNAGTLAGSFTSFVLPALPPNLSWDISQVNVTGVIRVVGSPVVSSVLYGPGTVQLIGTGDAALAGQSYRVLTSTDMTLPYTSWTVAYTGVFDGSGNFDTGAFAVTPSDTKRFYVVVYP